MTIHIERQEVTSTLYIGKMAKDVTESVVHLCNSFNITQDISALVKSLGSETEKVIVLLDPHTKESKGSGFVKFPSREDAKHCLAVRIYSTQPILDRNSKRFIQNGLYNGQELTHLLPLPQPQQELLAQSTLEESRKMLMKI